MCRIGSLTGPRAWPGVHADHASLTTDSQAVYDYTIVYHPHGHARPSERSLLFGTLPKEVHVHITRHGVEALPEMANETAVKVIPFPPLPTP